MRRVRKVERKSRDRAGHDKSEKRGEKEKKRKREDEEESEKGYK